MAISVGQVYRRYDKHDQAVHRILIVEYYPGGNRARVVNADTGKRPRDILVSSLHAGPGPGGRPRSTGYTLELLGGVS